MRLVLVWEQEEKGPKRSRQLLMRWPTLARSHGPSGVAPEKSLEPLWTSLILWEASHVAKWRGPNGARKVNHLKRRTWATLTFFWSHHPQLGGGWDMGGIGWLPVASGNAYKHRYLLQIEDAALPRGPRKNYTGSDTLQNLWLEGGVDPPFNCKPSSNSEFQPQMATLFHIWSCRILKRQNVPLDEWSYVIRCISENGNSFAPFWNLIWISKRHGKSSIRIICASGVSAGGWGILLDPVS